MASSSLALAAVQFHVHLLFLFFLLVSPAPQASAADGTTTHLHLFMHDIATGSNPTAVQVVKGPGGGSSPIPGLAFGDTTVIDDALTESSSRTSAAVGRAQGLYMMSSQSGAVLTVVANLALTAGGYNGSSIAVMGRDDIAADVRELNVVGGTGRFRMATGYVLWRTASMSGPDATIELDVYVTTAAPGGGGATIDASTPVSPVVDAGASASAAAATATIIEGWVSSAACAVVALLAAACI